MPAVVGASLLAAMLGGCAVVAVTGAVVGAGVTVASTAVDVGVAAGKGVVSVGKAVAGSGDDEKK
ncbi:hypothetical protein [Massilia sp. BJB1822]|uniref:hypothetical protein n=1 Tax=Massilia sp. BJB1822 TaxID=2744470 RepID=UPI001E5B4E68|nr:hypothetical protein [Massilia sp. BJB1822]